MTQGSGSGVLRIQVRVTGLIHHLLKVKHYILHLGAIFAAHLLQPLLDRVELLLQIGRSLHGHAPGRVLGVRLLLLLLELGCDVLAENRKKKMK